jgi:rRNA-processing protein FCF1
VPEAVIGELGRLEKKAGPKRSLLAKTALELAKRKFKILPAAGKEIFNVDEWIIDYATRNKCAVATIDANLRKRLVSNGIYVITLSKDRMLLANPQRDDQI